MKTKLISLFTAFVFSLLSAVPAYAIVLDGYNKNDEYDTEKNKPFNLFEDNTVSGNGAYWAQAFVKTEDTLCYIIFNVLCDGVTDNCPAGVIIKADGETLKADLTQKEYEEYDRRKFDFSYVGKSKAGGFTVEVRINFKNGLEDGKTITVQVLDASGEPSAVKDMIIRQIPPTTTEKTTKLTTEKTTKEKTTKEKTTKETTEKTTKPTTEKTTKTTTTKPAATKEKPAAEAKTGREITHRAVTTTLKKEQTAAAGTSKPAKDSKEKTTKFKAQSYISEKTTTAQKHPDERLTDSYTGEVTYSYITEEYITSPESRSDTSKIKKKVAALVSMTLVIAACVFGSVSSKKEKPDE
ncbi:MAG: hypothetical protein IJK60_03150 [Clostridia bacterium]|nr:hypothetical protein [Clostridia bacterium]